VCWRRRNPSPPPQAYPEKFAQEALGHNSEAVHRAYAKHAEVTVPSLADWENDWQENPQRNVQPKLLLVDFRLPLIAAAQSDQRLVTGLVCQPPFAMKPGTPVATTELSLLLV